MSAGQVDAIRRTFGVHQEMDVMRGGGHARHQLASYVTTVVTPLLHENDPGTATGRALYEAGAGCDDDCPARRLGAVVSFDGSRHRPTATPRGHADSPPVADFLAVADTLSPEW